MSIHRSALLVATDEQRDMAELTDRGYGDITTQIAPASDFEYFYAEDHHQQYLYKLPNGYRCHANTGLALPVVSSS